MIDKYFDSVMGNPKKHVMPKSFFEVQKKIDAIHKDYAQNKIPECLLTPKVTESYQVLNTEVKFPKDVVFGSLPKDAVTFVSFLGNMRTLCVFSGRG